MKALVLKDLRVLRPWWGLIVLGHLLFTANGIVAPPAFFVVNAALTWALTVMLLMVDWSQEADRFLASLPVDRRDVVKARYVQGLATAAAGTFLYVLYGRVWLTFATQRLLERWPAVRGWESVSGLLAFFLTVWLVTMVFLPFHFRWGLGKGSWLFLVGAAVLTMAGATLVRAGALPAMRGDLSTALGTPAAALLVLAVAAAFGGLSLRLSIRFFERRDL